MTINPLSVDVIQWASSFEFYLKRKITIDTIQVANVELERGITARISVSGDKDVRNSLKSLIKSKNYELERIQIRLSLNGNFVPIQLTNSGGVKLDEAYVGELLPALRASVPKAPHA